MKLKEFTLFALCLILLMFGVSGCGFLGDDGRMQAASEMHQSDNNMLGNAVNALMTQQQLAPANPTVKVEFTDSGGKPVTITQDFAPMLSAATGHYREADAITALTKNKSTPIPKGAVAEGLDATARVLSTPTAIVGATGAAVGSAIRAAEPGVKVTNTGDGTIDMKGVNTTKNVAAINNGSGSAGAADNSVKTKTKTSNSDSGNTDAPTDSGNTSTTTTTP